MASYYFSYSSNGDSPLVSKEDVLIGNKSSSSHTNSFLVEEDLLEEISYAPPNTIIAVISATPERKKAIVVPLKKYKTFSQETSKTSRPNITKKRTNDRFPQITDSKYF